MTSKNNSASNPPPTKKKLSSQEASEKMIEIQTEILQQMKSIAGSMKELVELAKSGVFCRSETFVME